MRKQIAFATLNESEINQVAQWLRTETYAVVLERVRKPRADGGLGLKISRSPLERLRDKHERLNKVNACIASGKPLSLAELDAINACEAPASNEAHDAIMQATLDLAKSGEQSATQLLALQRLADFPERAEIREQRLELDFEKFAHKLDMDAHRKQIALARLELANKSLVFREKMHQDRLNLALQKAESKTPTPGKEDRLGSLATDWKAAGRRVRAQFNISDEEAARRKKLNQLHRESQKAAGTSEPQLAQTLLPDVAADFSPRAPHSDPTPIQQLNDPTIQQRTTNQ